MRLPRSFHVLRHGMFARYLVANSVSTLGSSMAMVALAFAVLEFGSASDLGVVLLARELPVIVFLLLGGVYADRLPRRVILVGTDVVKGLSQGLTAVLLVTGLAEVWTVALLQAVFGVAAAFSRPATTGIVRETVDDGSLQEANALLHLSSSVLSVAGPAIGGLVVVIGSPASAVAVDALTFLVSAIFIGSMRLAPTVRVVKRSVLGDLHDGWREFIARPWVVVLVASFGLFQLTYFPAVFVLGPVVADQHLGGAAVWGVILAATSVGAFVGGILVLRLRFSRPLVAVELLVVPAGLFVMSLAVPLAPPAIIVIGALSGAGFAMGDVIWMSTLQRKVPEHVLSRISSFDWLGSVALNPIGYLVIGPLSERIGIPLTLAIAGSLNLAISLGAAMLPAIRSVRDTDQPDEPDTPDAPLAIVAAPS